MRKNEEGEYSGRCPVTAAVQRLLDSYDALSDAEKHDAGVEVLRRVQEEAPLELPEEALVEAADELFRDLDAREAADAQP
jgi:hypothetical protein